MSRPVFEMAFTARPEHIDELGHVNNAVWVQWIQQVAVAHWDAVADAGAQGRLFLGRGAARDRLSARRARGRPDHRADLGRRGAARARGSTATWNSSAPTGKSASARGRSWAIIDKASGRPIRVPAEVVAPFMAASVSEPA